MKSKLKDELLGLSQPLKNYLGDLLELSRCAVTGDSCFGGEYFSLPYSSSGSLCFSARALREGFSVDDIVGEAYARAVQGESGPFSRPPSHFYTREQIMREMMTLRERYDRNPDDFPFEKGPISI
jgi:hypothetical protein